MIANHSLVLNRIFICCCCAVCVTLFYVYTTSQNRLPTRRWVIPVSNHRFYPSNWTLLNLKRFEFLLNSNVCDGMDRIELLVIVTSHPGNANLRNAFRRALPKQELVKFNIRRLFLLARIDPNQMGYRRVEQLVIEEEHLAHNDIVQGDFTESYHNLSYKHVMGLKYATHFCRQAELILKMDDDIAVDVFQLLRLVRDLSLSGMQMAGALMTGDELNPVRDRNSKWYVSRDDYASSRYPPFVSGWAYVTTIEAARQLVRHGESSPFFWIDDIYVTGMLASLSGLKRVDIRPRFTVYTDHLKCCLRRKHSSSTTTACDYFVGPSGDNADLIEDFHRQSLVWRSNIASQQTEKPSLCILAVNESSGYNLKGRVIYGQVIPLS